MQLFEKNGHQIIHGDALEVLHSKVIPDHSIDLIFIDPPYNIGKDFKGIKDKWKSDEEYLEWSYKWMDLCIQKLNKSGSFYIMTATQFMPYYDLYLRNKLNILSRIVWSYDSSGVQARKYYGSMYEPILYCVKNKENYTFNSDDILIEAKTGAKRKLIDYRKNPPQLYNTKKIPGNVWEYPRVRYRMEEYEDHPSQKPILLMERIIRASSNEGDVILDPFAGTFTTSFVGQKLKRRTIGIELNNEYVKTGLRRIEILEELNGEKLEKPLKSYEVRNAHSDLIPGLFDQ
ncbi:MAG: adenine-specific DNA-methyltransferase [Ekhidna sp.]|nr:adenine-specific DNA-methyltransferase [Ekhidna sp.]